jgi:hypothetical protein
MNRVDDTRADDSRHAEGDSPWGRGVHWPVAVNRPRRLDPLAERVLSLLSGRPECDRIVLGGYLALQHYLDYRTTHDIDAWWHERADPAAERVIRQVMQQVAEESAMALRERRFGDTLSFELVQEGQHRFSFQIAVRAIAVEEPQPSAWPPLRVETLADNVGAKMNALVNRGAPRDFRDVHAVVHAGLLTPRRCWELWQAKNPGGAIEAARQNLLLHLAGLDSRRPLEGIVEPEARERARRVRQWFSDVFVRG